MGRYRAKPVKTLETDETIRLTVVGGTTAEESEFPHMASTYIMYLYIILCINVYIRYQLRKLDTRITVLFKKEGGRCFRIKLSEIKYSHACFKFKYVTYTQISFFFL